MVTGFILFLITIQKISLLCSFDYLNMVSNLCGLVVMVLKVILYPFVIGHFEHMANNNTCLTSIFISIELWSHDFFVLLCKAPAIQQAY